MNFRGTQKKENYARRHDRLFIRMVGLRPHDRAEVRGCYRCFRGEAAEAQVDVAEAEFELRSVCFPKLRQEKRFLAGRWVLPPVPVTLPGTQQDLVNDC